MVSLEILKGVLKLPPAKEKSPAPKTVVSSAEPAQKAVYSEQQMMDDARGHSAEAEQAAAQAAMQRSVGQVPLSTRALLENKMTTEALSRGYIGGGDGPGDMTEEERIRLRRELRK